MVQQKNKGAQSEGEARTPVWGRAFIWLAGFYWLLPLLGGVVYFAGGRIFLTFGLVMTAAGFCSFVFYGVDKLLALKQYRRIPEISLLAWDLLGGWPGGLLGQSLFRHKTVKVSYRIKFLLCVFLNAGVTVWLIRESGHWFR